MTHTDDSHRPWGFYDILSNGADYKVKSITVYPEKRLSLQSHHRRSEHWFMVSGSGIVQIGDRDVPVKAGSAVDIERAEKHRITNTGSENLVFVEIQTGDYFGEDDIVRYEDDFGRA